MSYCAKNIGEFNMCFLSSATWDDGGYSNDVLNLHDGMLLTKNYFHFHAPNSRIDCSLRWIPKRRELICRLIVMDLDTEEMREYVGDEELSHPEPSRYMWYLQQRCHEITQGSRWSWTTASVEGGYTPPTDEEMDEIEKELGLEPVSKDKV